jgi:ATP/maltotriose-dependent transcriptional regulator MalT
VSNLDALNEARAAFGRREWRAAHAAYSAASRGENLPTDDLERFAIAAHLFGREAESRELLAHGYRDSLGQGDLPRAARFAFWVSQSLIFTDDQSQASAWQGRARAAIEEHGADCVESGYLSVLDGIRALSSGDPSAAEATFGHAQEIALRYADATLHAMAGHGRGRALIALGRVPEGMACLDEVMVSATADEVSPQIVGDTYCGALEACHDVFDVRRATEWTLALTRWCESQPDLVPYRGPCLVHRVELMRIRGEWPVALEEAQRACEWLSMPASPEGAGDAHYQMAELHRLRGQYAEAEAAYRQAVRCGRRPEPGLPLLWLARGQGESAKTALRRSLDESGNDRCLRATLLVAYVEVLLALGDTAGARAAATELAEIARLLDSLFLSAAVDDVEGRLAIVDGSGADALAPLRRAWMAWQRLDAPFEAARERVQIGIVYRELGDTESAAMEFDAARWVFQQLGARPALESLNALAPSLSTMDRVGGLTVREVEVLRLVAEGRTNKEIASALVISEHTVARHVQNMLAKLAFSSRTQLAAFAVESGVAAGRRSQL